jgi:succinyl-diaminopimelate desuccinylase
MKAGVAAFVTAVCGLAAQLKETRGVVLVITGGEETGCEGAAV